MAQQTCPACGAPVKIASALSVYLVCSYCRASLLKTDVGLEHLGQVAMLQEDPSVLQIGTGGKIDGVHFGLIGRIQLTWEQGFWNEWYLLDDRGETGWLAEAQGFYMVSRELTDAEIPDKASLSPGSTVQIGSRTFLVDDIKEVRCTFSEGELPFRGDPGTQITSIDLSGPENAFASVSYSEGKKHCFVGKYLAFDEFAFSNLKQIDW